MAQRRYGPTRGAGVAIIEENADKPIEPAALGVTGYVGILQKGRIGQLTRISNPNQAKKKIGSYISESVLPDSIFDFFDTGNGAGEVHVVRVTSGNEKTSSVMVKNRKNRLKNEVIKISADNAGRWAGKKQTVVGQYTAVTATSLSTGKTFKQDELKGGILTLAELPGKSFKIEGNSTAGVINLAPDATLAADLALSGGGNLTYAATLVNEGKGLAVLFTDGVENPTTEWAMYVYEDGIEVYKQENLSSDPNSPRYFEPIINDDDSNVYVKVDDQFSGTITLDTRPANYSGISKQLTALVLTSNVCIAQASAANDAEVVFTETLGSSALQDQITLTCAASGTRPTGNLLIATLPVADTTLTLDFSPLEDVTGTKLITFKTVVTDPLAQVLIGLDEAATRTNLLAFLQAMTYAAGRFKYAAGAGASIDVVGLDANDLLNAGTEFTQSAAHFTFTQMIGGVNQTWNYTSANQPDLPATVVTTGKVFAAPNAYLVGGRINSVHADDDFVATDIISIVCDPYPVNGFVGGLLIPNKAERRVKFEIISNTANTITVKSGSDMTIDASTGDEYIVQALSELGGGYDGIAGMTDQNYIDAYNVSNSAFNQLLTQNKGLVKLSTPGVTSTSVQKAGASYAEAKNYQYRYEIPANITSDESAEAYVNDTLGRNDFAVVSFPSFVYVVDPLGQGGLKLISSAGMIQGREALMAKNYKGYHKAAAGIDVTLPRIVKLPTGDRVIDEEFLTPQGFNFIKKKEGNFIVWGDRTVSIDPSFKFKHAREYLSHIEHILQENFDFIIFALNNTETAELAKTSLIAFFLGEYNIGAFEGDSFKKAVRIKLDSEINTPLTLSTGDLNAQIRVKIVNTVERFNISIGKAGIFEELG